MRKRSMFKLSKPVEPFIYRQANTICFHQPYNRDNAPTL